MRVVDSIEMREIENRAEKLGIPTLLLMENAAKEIFYQLRQFIETNKLFNPGILIFCGRGNNGGDGLALARHLFNHGYNVSIIMVKGDRPLSRDSEINFNVVKNFGIKIFEIENIDESLLSSIYQSHIIIDALLGTGITRELEGIYLSLVRVINESGKPVISVDIPSGINACNGKVMGEAVKATKTVSLGLIKLGHLLFPGRSYCGELSLVDISLHPECRVEGNFNIILEEEAKKYFRKRELNSHKGSFGHTVIIGGSNGKFGAPLLASFAALKAGAGLVTAVIPQNVSLAFQSSFPEIMTFPVKDWLEETDNIIRFLKDKDALILGCGLGMGDNEEEFFFKLIEQIEIPLLIDADGLNILSKNTNALKNLKVTPILTPHIGEMARLIKLEKKKIIEEPHLIAKNFAKGFNCHLVLKSATTTVADPEGRVYFSVFGNPGMATAGSGDALSGIIGSFLGQGYENISSIKMGLALHGLAGDMAKEEVGESSLTATDLINNMCRILKKWEEE